MLVCLLHITHTVNIDHRKAWMQSAEVKDFSAVVGGVVVVSAGWMPPAGPGVWTKVCPIHEQSGLCTGGGPDDDGRGEVVLCVERRCCVELPWIFNVLEP